MMYDLEETPTVESFAFDDGEVRWYGEWMYRIHGYMIANVAKERYGKKLTPDEVSAIVSDVEDKIDDHVWELIYECIAEREG